MRGDPSAEGCVYLFVLIIGSNFLVNSQQFFKAGVFMDGAGGEAFEGGMMK